VTKGGEVKGGDEGVARGTQLEARKRDAGSQARRLARSLARSLPRVKTLRGKRCVVLTGIVVFLKVARRRALHDRIVQVHVRRRLILRRERHLHCIISARGSPCIHINT